MIIIPKIVKRVLNYLKFRLGGRVAFIATRLVGQHKLGTYVGQQPVATESSGEAE